MHRLDQLSRCALAVLLLVVAAGCRDRTPAPSDSSLSQDLALAQRSGVTQTVFNDAPVGTPAPAAPAAGAPTKRPEPPRAKAPSPRPSPRPESPPAPVVRSPQNTPPEPVATSPAPSPAPAPAPAAGIIGSGTLVGMTTNAKVCTAKLLVGDKFTATVTSGTSGTNGAYIPAGASVVLEVASVDRADPIESSRIEFRVRAIDVNGEATPVSGDVATLGPMDKVQTSSGNDRNKVIGGAIAGAVLGKIFGGSAKATVIGGAAGAAAGAAAAKSSQSTEACLPEGSSLRLTLTRDIVVRRGAN